MKPIETEEDTLTLLRGAKALAVVSAWSGLGLFEALKDGPKPLAELQADPRALATTAPVLRHLGLLVGDTERIGLSSTARELLNRNEMPTERTLELLRDTARMAEVLKNGGPATDDSGTPKATKGGVTESPERTAAFLDVLYRRSDKSAQQTLQWLRARLTAGGQVLDVGGGHGRYARCFADAGFKATLFDLPHVIEYARRRHCDHIGYLSGDYHTSDDFGGPYDLILLSNIIHSESDASCQRLLQRLACAMRPGGYITIKDMFLDETEGDPMAAVFFGLTMLYYTNEGRSPRLDQTKAWLVEAGLTDTQVIAFGSFSVVTARRPEVPLHTRR